MLTNKLKILNGSQIDELYAIVPRRTVQSERTYRALTLIKKWICPYWGQSKIPQVAYNGL